MKRVIITANLNTIYVRRGETKEVELTPQIQAAIDGGRLIDLTPPPKRKPRKPKEETTVEPSDLG